MNCYRESTCRVRLHGERACLHRFIEDHCPHSQLGGDDEEGEMDSETGASAEDGETTAEEM